MASEIGKIGVVGTGLMGSSVAQAPRLLGQLGISDSAFNYRETESSAPKPMEHRRLIVDSDIPRAKNAEVAAVQSPVIFFLFGCAPCVLGAKYAEVHLRLCCARRFAIFATKRYLGR